eukprot:2247035-Lingulodinium_polyedra.AAC.1
MDPVYQVMTQGDPTARLFAFDYYQYLTQFKKGAATLGRPQCVPYQRRHSGASADRGDRSRPLGEVQRRG